VQETVRTWDVVLSEILMVAVALFREAWKARDVAVTGWLGAVVGTAGRQAVVVGKAA
jgi:hypothetical protein